MNLSKAIKRQRTAEYKVLQFSRIFTTIFKTQRWVVFSVDLTYWRIKTSSSSITSTICNGTNFELLILSFTGWASIARNFFIVTSISTQSSSAHVEERDQELWGTLEQDCLWLVSAKTIKVFWLVHSSLHESDWTCGVSGMWAGFSLEMCSKHARPILDFSDSKTTVARPIRQN